MSAGVVLASKSATRRAVLEGAGVPFDTASSGVDEDLAKEELLAKGAAPRRIAEALTSMTSSFLRSKGPSGESRNSCTPPKRSCKVSDQSTYRPFCTPYRT